MAKTLQSGPAFAATKLLMSIPRIMCYKSAASVQNDQLSLEGAAAESLMDELKNIDATTLTPIEAMKILYDLTEKAKNI